MLRFFVNNISRLDSCCQNECEVMIVLLLSRDLFFLIAKNMKLLSDVGKKITTQKKGIAIIII